MAQRRRDFSLPPIGSGSEAARVVNWLITVGDRLVIGRPICSVEADGLITEFTAPFAGPVIEVGAAVGDLVVAGDLLVAVADEDANLNTDLNAEANSDTEENEQSETAASGGGTRSKYSPLVRRLAEEFEIDLTKVEGTGSGGRITRDDVHRAAFPGEPLPGEAVSTPASVEDDQAGAGAGEDEADPGIEDADPETETDVDVDVDVEQDDAEQALEANNEIAVTAEGKAEPEPKTAGGAVVAAVARSSFTVISTADAVQLLRAHEQMASSSGRDLGLDALLLKLTVAAVTDYPALAGDAGDGSVTVGFSRPTAHGMTTSLVTDVASRSLLELDLMMHDAAREQLVAGPKPGESTVAPLTMLDAGALGMTAVTPTIPVGGVACVAIGQPEPTLRLVDGLPQAGSTLSITGTFDEATIDLTEASAFINRLRLYVEDPILAFAG